MARRRDGRFDKPYRLNVRSELARVTGRRIEPLPQALQRLEAQPLR